MDLVHNGGGFWAESTFHVIRLKDQMKFYQKIMNLTIRDLCENLAPKLLEYEPRYGAAGELDKAQTLRVDDVMCDKFTLEKTANLTLSLCKICVVKSRQ